ncbi:MAG: hypothetical protein ACFFBD_17130 [Candidatus Hodarchaeota archaeon]
MIYDAEKGIIKYDTFCSTIPLSVNAKQTSLEKRDQQRLSLQYTIEIPDLWGQVVAKIIYEADVVFTLNIPSPETKTFIMNLEFTIRTEGDSLYLSNKTPFALVGSSSSIDLPGCPGNGSTLRSDINLFVPTDYFIDGTLTSHHGPNYHYCISFDTEAGEFIVENDTDWFTIVSEDGNRLSIRHTPKCDFWGN